MPAAAPILLIGGLAAIIALLAGGRKAKAAPHQLPPKEPPAPPDKPPTVVPISCSKEDRDFVANVMLASTKGTATTEMLQKAINVAKSCGMQDAVSVLKTKLKVLLQEVEEAKEEAKKTGVVKVTSIKKSTPKYVCGVLPGRGYACRPKDNKWRVKAKRFQNALNIAAFKLPGPAETPRLIKVDGAIGPKTMHLLEVVAKRIELPKFEAFKNIVATSSMEDVSDNLRVLTGALTRYVQLKAVTTTQAVTGHYGMGHVAPLPGVSPRQWVSFVKCMAGRGSPRGLGIFKMNPSRLKKLGVEEFPESREEQYQLFAADMRLLAKGVLNTPLKEFVGSPLFPGQGAVSLSGILALCKQAGLKGALSWLENPEDHERFPNTTKAYLACNGIF